MQVHIEPRSITVEGRAYSVRRLNVKDMFRVGRIVTVALERSGGKLTVSPEAWTKESVLAGLLTSTLWAESVIIELCASLIDVTPDEFAEMPPTTLTDLIEVLAGGEDLKAFFDSCVRLIKANEMELDWKLPLTSFNHATDGQTT